MGEFQPEDDRLDSMQFGPFEMLRPAILLFLPAGLALLAWWHLRSIGPLRAGRRNLAFAMRCVVFLLLVLALSEPRWMGRSTKREVLLLVDQSRSLDAAGLEAAQAFAAKADFAGAETAWIGFGGKGRVAREAEELRKGDPARVQPDETRLDTAFALAAASFRPDRVKTAVLFSDGVSTGGLPDAEALAAQGIRVEVVPVDPPDRPEVLVRDLSAPTHVRAEEPLAIEATIFSTRPGPVTVNLFRNGVRIATKQMEHPGSGTQIVRFDDRATDEKLLHYEVGVQAAADTLAENNQLGTVVIAQGDSRVLLLSDQPEAARYFEWALKQEGVNLDVRPAEGVPTEMSDLQKYDTLIIDNLPASAFQPAQMALVHSYVRDFGGGLMMLGGDQAYGLGGYFRTPVEDVLPVSCDFQKDEENPSMALMLVIDRSGSMSGDKLELAKSAARASADLLGPRDYVGLVVFDNDATLAAPLQAAIPGAISSAIASITADGGTNIAPAMEEAEDQLRNSTAKIRHVILLTDGMSQEGPFQELATRMAQNGVTISTVGMGEGADGQLLSEIAQWGNGRYYEATDPTSVPQVFTKETMTASKSAIQEFPFQVKPVRAVDFLDGIEWNASPFLLGYVRTRAKPTSEVWLISERGDPVLTTWRFGLGMTAAFTSDARNRWAVEWLRWPGFGKFWSQLLRRMGRSPAMGGSEMTLTGQENHLTIRLDALDPTGQGFPEEATASVQLNLPGGKVAAVPLEKIRPGHWEARYPLTERGIIFGQAQLTHGEQILDSRVFTYTRGFPREFLMEPLALESLTTLATATGGSVNPDPAAIFRADRRTAVREHELWPWLALAAVLLFVTDVGIRRWPSA